MGVSKEVKNEKKFIYSISYGFILSVLFSIIYAVFFYYFKDKNLLLIPTDINRSALDYILKFGIFSSIIFGIITFFKTLILWFLSYILRLSQFQIIKPIIYIINFKTCAIIGFRFIYFEPRNTSIGITIIEFFGKPLFYTSSIMTALMIIWLLVLIYINVFKKN